MDALTHETLTLTPSDDADKKLLTVRWTGRSTARSPTQILRPYLTLLNEHAVAEGLAIEMDFTTLEHFNSSTISALIQYLQDCRAKKLVLTLSYDGAVKWQRLSFEALRVFVKPDGLLTLRARA